MKPVSYGGRRVRGLHERTTKDGAVTFYGRLRIDGEDKRVVLQATTRTDAVREYENLRADRNRDRASENPLVNPIMADVFEEYLEHAQARVGISDERRRLSQNSVDACRWGYTHAAPVLGARRVVDVTPGDLRRLIARLQAKGLAPGSTARVMSAVSSALTFAVKSGYTASNPYRDVGRDDRPGSKRLTEPRYLAADEIELLLAHANPEHRPLFAVMAYAALRVSEARALTWANVDLKSDEIAVVQQLRRTGTTVVPVKSIASKSTVPIVPALRRLLVEHRGRQAERNLALVRPEAFVFTTRLRAAGPYTIAAVRFALGRAAARAGLDSPDVEPLGPHDLRHSAGALALQSGASIAEVSEFLRHASPLVTMQVYAGLTKDGRGAAARKLVAAGFGT